MLISKRKAIHRLAAAWTIGFALLFGLLLLQTLMGAYGDRSEEAWNWLLPTIMPTMLLIYGVLFSDLSGGVFETESVKKFLYRLTLWLSVFYLLIVSLHIIIPSLFSFPRLGTMSQSHIYMGPLQGLVGIAIGYFFGNKQKEETG
ncbi:hypothetical protein [Gracilimonas mengyeensis]|uniref:Uncharacterized protein n=1 Tax=Gracilimonas mengyeensis TaxID=1302730 RepID=A0A521E7Y5_9BACT|nr:hypothetical protein [Gracilimonas mengyeensis]SMO80034.1 hypothetical protein SAMN06265219_1113 [Gracilimonas mengyeensis]